MKDKAAVLLELEKLTTMKEELTEEVSRLHKLLEQERSSTKANSSNSISESHNATNQTSKHKDKVRNIIKCLTKKIINVLLGLILRNVAKINFNCLHHFFFCCVIF